MENILFIGEMNSGKTNKVKEEVKKIISSNESIIILDSKDEYSELFYNTDYEIKKVNLRDPKNSLGYNPFKYAQDEYKKNNIDKSINIIKKILFIKI